MLVNNLKRFYAGFFEEITPQDFRAQVETTMFGPINVTRAALPVLRAQRSGLVVAMSSTAGIVGQGVLHRLCRGQVRGRGLDRVADPEVAPFGIRTMLVEPGFPHRAAQPGVDQLRPALDRRLCRAHHPDRGRLERP